MGANRPSNEDAPRVPGEEGGRPWGKIVLGLILLLLLALLIPFACQALSGGSGGEQGSGAQDSSGEDENAKDQSSNDGSGDGSSKQAADQKETAAASTDNEDGGQDDDRSRVRAEVAPFSDQSGDGGAITIPRAKISGADGWIAIHANDGGEPGGVLGHAAIQEGENTDIEVKLDQPVDSGRLYAMVHAEDPADGDYTFPDGDPPVDQSGGMVVEPFEYAGTSDATGDPASASNGTSNDANTTGGAEDKPLPDSGGFGALALAGVFLLAVGSLMRRNLRA